MQARQRVSGSTARATHMQVALLGVFSLPTCKRVGVPVVASASGIEKAPWSFSAQNIIPGLPSEPGAAPRVLYSG